MMWDTKITHRLVAYEVLRMIGGGRVTVFEKTPIEWAIRLGDGRPYIMLSMTQEQQNQSLDELCDRLKPLLDGQKPAEAEPIAIFRNTPDGQRANAWFSASRPYELALERSK